MIVEGTVAAAAHAGGGRWMGAFRFGEEFFCVGFVVLALFDANLASPVAGPASIEIECADIVFLRAGGDVGANHANVIIPPNPGSKLYVPEGVLAYGVFFAEKPPEPSVSIAA